MKKDNEEQNDKPKKVMRPRKVKLDPLPEDETKTPISTDEEHVSEEHVVQPTSEVVKQDTATPVEQNTKQNNPVNNQVQQPQGEFAFKKENDSQNQNHNVSQHQNQQQQNYKR